MLFPSVNYEIHLIKVIGTSTLFRLLKHYRIGQLWSWMLNKWMRSDTGIGSLLLPVRPVGQEESRNKVNLLHFFRMMMQHQNGNPKKCFSPDIK